MPERLAPTARGVRQLEARVAVLEADQVIAENAIAHLNLDVAELRAALQAVASGLSIHAADDRRHVGKAAK